MSGDASADGTRFWAESRRYDRRHFLEIGIEHVEMYFDDGSNPTDEIVRDFIRLAEEVIERRGQKVAVHCKAGLGRTGVLVGGEQVDCVPHFVISAETSHSLSHLQIPLLSARGDRVHADRAARHGRWTAAAVYAGEPDEMGFMGELNKGSCMITP